MQLFFSGLAPLVVILHAVVYTAHYTSCGVVDNNIHHGRGERGSDRHAIPRNPSAKGKNKMMYTYQMKSEKENG